MNLPLRILHLEDNPDDVLLVRDLLQQDGVIAEITHVTYRAEFVAAIEKQTFDLIIADYRLPDFTGRDALMMIREKYPALPPQKQSYLC